MAQLLALVVFVLDILAIVDCIKGSKKGEEKALWILLILFLPLVGLILYYLLAKSKNA